jgi:site-specific DNA-cytosine methylase
VGGSYHTLDYWVTTLQSKLYKDNEGMNVEMYQVPKKRRRTTNMAEDSEDEDLDEDDDNWSDDDEHASGSRPRKSRSGHIKRKEYSTHAPAPSASDHQVARLTEEVRVLRQRVRTLEGIIQKAMSSAALLTSQLQVPPSDFS